MNFRKNEVTLYKNVNLTTKDTIKFKSLQEQENYFTGKVKTTIDSNEPLIIDKVRVSDITYLDLLEYTYVSSNQTITKGFGYQDKTFYYFIEELEYINEQLTIVHVKLDVYQTYLFDHDIKNSTIIREHQDRFDIYGNRIWNKEKEPVTVNDWNYLSEELLAEGNTNSKDVYYVISSRKPEGSISGSNISRYGNIPSYLETWVTAFKFNRTNKTMDKVYYTLNKTDNTTEEYAMAGLDTMSRVSYTPELVDILIVPHIPGFEVYTKNGKTYIKNDSFPKGAQNDKISWKSFGTDGGNIVVIKDLSIPDSFFETQNNSSVNEWFRGALTRLVPEKYSESKIYSPQFMEATVTVDVNNTFKFYLDELKKTGLVNNKLRFPYLFGNSVSKAFSLSVKDYTIPDNILVNTVKDGLVLMTDEYLNSLKFEANNRSAAKMNGIINAVAGLGISAVSGGALAPLALGQMTGLATQSISEKAKLDDLRSRPVKLGSEMDNTDFNFTSGLMRPRISLKVPTDSEINRLNKFFKEYGYASNRFGVPNLNNRETFNYVEATDMIITGSIPNNYKNELKTLFGSGIRLWHKTDDSQFLNFNISNNEVV